MKTLQHINDDIDIRVVPLTNENNIIRAKYEEVRKLQLTGLCGGAATDVMSRAELRGC